MPQRQQAAQLDGAIEMEWRVVGARQILVGQRQAGRGGEDGQGSKGEKASRGAGGRGSRGDGSGHGGASISDVKRDACCVFRWLTPRNTQHASRITDNASRMVLLPPRPSEPGDRVWG